MKVAHHVAGRRVRMPTRGDPPAGTHARERDGRDDDGRPTGAGVGSGGSVAGANTVSRALVRTR